MKFLTLSLCLLLSFNMMASDSSHSEMKMEKKKNLMSVSAEVKSQVLAAFASYDKLHSAFFKYDAKKIEAESKILLGLLNNISDRKLVSLLDKANVFAFLSAIKASNKKAVNNSLLDNTSKKLNELILSKFNIGNDYQAYYCPMVKKDWIQNTKESKDVRNPYSADMPSCGGLK
jgi:hypothetical protein